jgi:uncharacterized membrane protein YjdF
MQITLPKKDKAMHFAFGYVTTHAAKSIIPEYTDNKKIIKYGPIIMCIAVGVGKELVDKYDSNPKSTFEWLDIAYTAGGGITLITIDIKKKRPKPL